MYHNLAVNRMTYCLETMSTKNNNKLMFVFEILAQLFSLCQRQMATGMFDLSIIRLPW